MNNNIITWANREPGQWYVSQNRDITVKHKSRVSWKQKLQGDAFLTRNLEKMHEKIRLNRYQLIFDTQNQNLDSNLDKLKERIISTRDNYYQKHSIIFLIFAMILGLGKSVGSESEELINLINHIGKMREQRPAPVEQPIPMEQPEPLTQVAPEEEPAPVQEPMPPETQDFLDRLAALEALRGQEQEVQMHALAEDVAASANRDNVFKHLQTDLNHHIRFLRASFLSLDDDLFKRCAYHLSLPQLEVLHADRNGLGSLLSADEEAWLKIQQNPEQAEDALQALNEEDLTLFFETVQLLPDWNRGNWTQYVAGQNLISRINSVQ